MPPPPKYALLVNTKHSINNSLLIVDMNLYKCGRKSAYFFMEKQKYQKKRMKNENCVNSSLAMKLDLEFAHNLNVVTIFDRIKYLKIL